MRLHTLHLLGWWCSLESYTAKVYSHVYTPRPHSTLFTQSPSPWGYFFFFNNWMQSIKILRRARGAYTIVVPSSPFDWTLSGNVSSNLTCSIWMLPMFLWNKYSLEYMMCLSCGNRRVWKLQCRGCDRVFISIGFWFKWVSFSETRNFIRNVQLYVVIGLLICYYFP